MKKILIVSGCSWTDLNFSSDFHNLDCSWPKWHEILAKKLDVELVSLGKSGAGQEYIFNSIVEYISSLSEEDIKRIYMVIAAWTTPARRDYQVNREWYRLRFEDHGDVYYIVEKSLRYFYQFQVFCERFNFPYKQISMLNCVRLTDAELPAIYNYGPVDQEKAISYFITSPLFSKINKKNFIGWPCFTNIGGFNINGKYLSNLNNPNSNFRISSKDHHPNKKGNEEIARIIYENI